MLIEYIIKNRTFDPIKIKEIKQTIRESEDKTSTDKFYLKETTFPSDIGLFLKPFSQDKYAVNLITDLFEHYGKIYLDSTIITDSEDYGTFFHSFPIDINLNRKFVGVELFVNVDDVKNLIIKNTDSYDDLIFEFELSNSLIQNKILQTYKDLNLPLPKVILSDVKINIDTFKTEETLCISDGLASVDIEDDFLSENILNYTKRIYNYKDDVKIFLQLKKEDIDNIFTGISVYNSVHKDNKIYIVRTQIVYEFLIDLTPNIIDVKQKYYYNLKVYTSKFFHYIEETDTQEEIEARDNLIFKSLNYKNVVIDELSAYKLNDNKYALKGFFVVKNNVDYNLTEEDKIVLKTFQNIENINIDGTAFYENSEILLIDFLNFVQSKNNFIIPFDITTTPNPSNILIGTDFIINDSIEEKIAYADIYDNQLQCLQKFKLLNNILQLNENNDLILHIENYCKYPIIIKKLEFYDIDSTTSEYIKIFTKELQKSYIVSELERTNIYIPTIIKNKFKAVKIIYEENGIIKEKFAEIENISFNTTSIEQSFIYGDDNLLLKPNIASTLKLEINAIGITVTGYKILNGIKDSEIFIDDANFPLSGKSIVNIDVLPTEEKYYDATIRFETNSAVIKYFDVPIRFISTKIDIDEIIKFDEKSFFVLNNIYHISLKYLQEKIRKIKIKNTGNLPIKINNIYARSYSGIKIEILSNISGVELNPNEYLEILVKFKGLDFGNHVGLLQVETDYGTANLQVSGFINTKDKDSYVLMLNRRGVKIKSLLDSYTTDYIYLINFGDENSKIELNKYGANNDSFFVANKPYVSGLSIEKLEVAYVPTSTGTQISQLDIKLIDELITYHIYQGNNIVIDKIQNAHIIAELLGIAISENAVPYFVRNIVDFGAVSIEGILNKLYQKRYDIIEIKNLGANPFRILEINKTNPFSPYYTMIQNYPITVNSSIKIPIFVDLTKISQPGEYTDILQFVIEDNLKNILTYKIPLNIKVVEENEIFVDFNVDEINFGYASIDSLKIDEIYIKNFSTQAKNVRIYYNGDTEFSIFNLDINLQPNQIFKIPIYFLPKGIGTFEGYLNIDIDNGAYTKSAHLIGMGVDYKSPLIHIKSEIQEFLKKSIKQI